MYKISFNTIVKELDDTCPSVSRKCGTYMCPIHQSYLFKLWKSKKKYWTSVREHPWSI